MSDDINEILDEINSRKSRGGDNVDQLRQEKVTGFKLNLDLDAEFGSIPDDFSSDSFPSRMPDSPSHAGSQIGKEHERDNDSGWRRNTPAAESPRSPVSPAYEDNELYSGTEGAAVSAAPNAAEVKTAPHRTPAKKRSKAQRAAWGWVRSFAYVMFVILTSAVLIYFGITGAIDLMGFDKSENPVMVTITEEESTDVGKLAKLLEEHGIIDQPFIFRMYCMFNGVNKFQVKENVVLRASMGYETVINTLRSVDLVTVSVMFQEGMTAKEIAERLEEYSVCTAEDFLKALEEEEFTQSFLREIPDGGDYEYRYQRYEGFLFPDTYEFYVGETPVSVANKFFDAFGNKVDINLRIKMKAEGLQSVYDTITLASIIEWEANEGSMNEVSRVLQNRLHKPKAENGGLKLECDSTYRYLDQIIPSVEGKSKSDDPRYGYYDTYQKSGLPVSPICNPGINAILAALEPSTSNSVINCYYFATDLKTGTTYYSATFAEHERICRKYGIGAYA